MALTRMGKTMAVNPSIPGDGGGLRPSTVVTMQRQGEVYLWVDGLGRRRNDSAAHQLDCNSG
jgi:hypothetical protein